MLRDCWLSLVLWLGVLLAAIAVPLLTYNDAERSCLTSPALAAHAAATMSAPDATKDSAAYCERGP